MGFPKSKGLTKSVSGLKPVLMNEKSRSYIVDPKVFIVWSLCNGKNSLDEIKAKYGNRLGLESDESDVNIPEIINSLERIGLVQT